MSKTKLTPAQKAWKTRKAKQTRQHNAAVKAWKTRRANAA
jgi:hypothetical protein